MTDITTATESNALVTETKTYPLQKIGGRKFVLALIVVVAAFIEREVGNIDNSTLVQLVSAALGFFSAANVIQKFKGE